MLTQTKLLRGFHHIFRLLEGNADYYLDYSHKGHVYRLHIEDLGITVKSKRKKYRRSIKDKITSTRCTSCCKLELNGICINVSCTSQGGANASKVSTLEPLNSLVEHDAVAED